MTTKGEGFITGELDAGFHAPILARGTPAAFVEEHRAALRAQGMDEAVVMELFPAGDGSHDRVDVAKFNPNHDPKTGEFTSARARLVAGLLRRRARPVDEETPVVPDKSLAIARTINDIYRRQYARAKGFAKEQARKRAHHASAKRDGLFIARMVENVSDWQAWAASVGLPPLDPDLHVTQLFSSVGVQLPLATAHVAISPNAITELGHLGKDDAVVVFFDEPLLSARYKEAMEAGAKTSYDSFRPHLTLFYDPGKRIVLETLQLPLYFPPILLGPEYAGPLAEDVFQSARAKGFAKAWDESQHPRERDGKGGKKDGHVRQRNTSKDAAAVTPTTWESVPPLIREALRRTNGRVVVEKEPEQKVVGWASIAAHGDGLPFVDLQDQVVELPELERAVQRWRATSERQRVSVRHGKHGEPADVGSFTEFFVVTPAVKVDLQLDAETPLGLMVAAHITDPDTWKRVEAGEFQGWSIGGAAIPVPIMVQAPVEKGRWDESQHPRERDGKGGKKDGQFASKGGEGKASGPKSSEPFAMRRTPYKSPSKRFQNFEAKAYGLPAESGFMETAHGLAYEFRGTKTRLDIPVSLLKDMGTGATLSHNHPSGVVHPSVADLLLAASFGIAEFRIVSRAQNGDLLVSLLRLPPRRRDERLVGSLVQEHYPVAYLDRRDTAHIKRLAKALGGTYAITRHAPPKPAKARVGYVPSWMSKEADPQSPQPMFILDEQATIEEVVVAIQQLRRRLRRADVAKVLRAQVEKWDESQHPRVKDGPGGEPDGRFTSKGGRAKRAAKSKRKLVGVIEGAQVFQEGGKFYDRHGVRIYPDTTRIAGPFRVPLQEGETLGPRARTNAFRPKGVRVGAAASPAKAKSAAVIAQFLRARAGSVSTAQLANLQNPSRVREIARAVAGQRGARAVAAVQSILDRPPPRPRKKVEVAVPRRVEPNVGRGLAFRMLTQPKTKTGEPLLTRRRSHVLLLDMDGHLLDQGPSNRTTTGLARALAGAFTGVALITRRGKITSSLVFMPDGKWQAGQVQHVVNRYNRLYRKKYRYAPVKAGEYGGHHRFAVPAGRKRRLRPGITPEYRDARVAHFLSRRREDTVTPKELAAVRRRFSKEMLVAVCKARGTYNADQPRDKKGTPTGGRWTKVIGGFVDKLRGQLRVKVEQGGQQHRVVVEPVVGERAWNGKPGAGKSTSKFQNHGPLGERIVAALLIAAMPTRRVVDQNDREKNAPVDLVQEGLRMVEVKTGLTSNGRSAMQWRVTDNAKLSKKEQRRFDQLDKAARTRLKQRRLQAAMKRKEDFVRTYRKETGRAVPSLTVALIMDRRRQLVDVYEFKGFHLQIGWNSPLAQAHYVRTVRYRTR